MPKARGGSSTRSAPAKRGEPAPKPAPVPATRSAAPPAPAPKTAAPPAPAHAPQSAVGAPSQGGGFLSGVAQTALGVAGGHVIANTVMGAFGGGSKHEAAAAPAAADSSAMSNPADRCNVQYAGFLKCMESNQNQISSCQWAYDFWNQCQKTSSQEKFM